MKLGKLSNDKLDSLILSKFGHMRKEVVCSPHVGVDCAAVDLGGRIAVLSTDPITAADKNIGSLTVHVSCNDAAAAGAEPIGLLVTLLIPPHGTEGRAYSPRAIRGCEACEYRNNRRPYRGNRFGDPLCHLCCSNSPGG